MKDVALRGILDKLHAARKNIARQFDDLTLDRIKIIFQSWLTRHRTDDLTTLEGDRYFFRIILSTATTEEDIFTSAAGGIDIYPLTHKKYVEWFVLRRAGRIDTSRGGKDIDVRDVKVLKLFHTVLSGINADDLVLQILVRDLPRGDVGKSIGCP